MNSRMFSKDECNQLGQLIRMSMAFHQKNAAEMMQYFLDTYKIKISNESEMSRLRGGNGTAKNIKNEAYDKWINFIQREREILQQTFYSEHSFSSSPYHFNYESASKMIDAAFGANKCIFFNTYISIEDWNSPLIQMHLCIQKSIEQRNNYTHMIDCHDAHKSGNNKKDKIKGCNSNPPQYRHYRILLLQDTSEELYEKIDSDSRFLEKLKFSAIMHKSLSIQLGILTVNELSKIIKDNQAFFNQNNLKALGLNPEIENTSSNINDTIELLKVDLKSMSTPPIEHTNNSIDFMHIQNDSDYKIWSAHKNHREGLTYQPVEIEEYAAIKNSFTQIMFNSMVELTTAREESFFEFDALDSFYREKDLRFLRFKKQYNPFDKDIF